MEPKGSLPHSEEPFTCPYPEPYQSSQSIPLFKDPFKYYQPIYAYVFQMVSFPQASPPKPYVNLSSFPFVLHAPPILSLSVINNFAVLCSLDLLPFISAGDKPTVKIFVMFNNYVMRLKCVMSGRQLSF